MDHYLSLWEDIDCDLGLNSWVSSASFTDVIYSTINEIYENDTLDKYKIGKQEPSWDVLGSYIDIYNKLVLKPNWITKTTFIISSKSNIKQYGYVNANTVDFTVNLSNLL